jgi:hypothetical protein
MSPSGLVFTVPGPPAALALPVAGWEFSLGVWLTVKGFKATGLASLNAAPAHHAFPIPVA